MEGSEPLQWLLRDFIMKKYAGRRGVPRFVLKDLDKDLEKKKRKIEKSNGKTREAKRMKIEPLQSCIASVRGGFETGAQIRFATSWYPFGSDIE